MSYSVAQFSYSGGPRTFNTNFAMGTLDVSDIVAFVVGEVDGLGAQIYRAFTYNSTTGAVTITNAISGPYPRRVRIERRTPIDEPYVDFGAGADITRRNLRDAVRQALMGTQEAQDKVDEFMKIYPIEDYATALEAAVEQAHDYASDANLSASNAGVSAGQAQAVANIILTSSQLFGTYGGTANAITLSTGLPLTSVRNRQRFRFRAGVTNTGPATINVDGLGAVPCVTVTGVALPSNYIRTTVDTEIVYLQDTNQFVVDRAPQYGQNANGGFTRYADGSQVCSHTFTSAGGPNTASGAVFTSAADTWTFPMEFSTTTELIVSASVQFAGRWINVSLTTTTSASFRQFAGASAAGTAAIWCTAIGRWY